MNSTSNDSTRTAALKFSDESSFIRIGLLLLSTDLTTEEDFYMMRRDNRLRIHTTRLEYANPVTPENLRATTPRLSLAASMLPPETPLKAVYYGCTSATAVIGDDLVSSYIHKALPGVPVITPLNAAIKALEALQTKRISILAPYIADSVKPVADFFRQQGCSVQNVLGLGLEDDRDMARLEPDSIVETAVQAMSDDSEALFISCTALRSPEVAARIEEKTGRPVITSNQAAAWRLFTMNGLDLPGIKFGRLMTLKG